ncbi:MAG: bifunctional UDP-N-acetylmuramoyl-tripeptide:D-alanyl-D-alanine ligase/alanine racemase [Lentimicrobiaceae bacterium]|nr:bifunctional UDP-N-acetylmuramoyl-tripeptide:D-alanyl-D-alanine ligase/alanine racemase [Lentimicrobiaceae bacterium]
MPYTIDEIHSIVGGNMVLRGEETLPVSELLIDSRRLLIPQKTIFFAFISSRNDGHRYIHELYTRGVRNFIVSGIPGNLPTDEPPNVILVEDTLKALQTLTAYHRNQFSCPVIGITGSNGKTIVKEWLFQLMGKDKRIVRSPKSYNSQIGVPLSVWQMDHDDELAIIEAGISHPGEMEHIESIVRPTMGIFTNIGQAHDENFISLKQKISEKLKLFIHANTLIYCADHELIDKAIRSDGTLSGKKLLTWGHTKDAHLHITSIERSGSTTRITGSYLQKPGSITIPFTDNASIENAIVCWLVMLLSGYDPIIIQDRMRWLSPIAMRMEMKEGINHCSILNDSYSADVKSLNIALDFLDQQKQHDRKTVILSDFLQTGKDDAVLYNEIANLLSGKKIDRLIGIGPRIKDQSRRFPMEKVFYADTDAFIRDFHPHQFRDEAVLLKGARVFEFEKISTLLQQKAHETVLEINLDALIFNLNYFRGLLGPSTRIMVMVKAFSYGIGSYEIASLLQYHQTDYLAVAYADEGYDLRKAGITMPIIVMNPEEESMEGMVRNQLEPEIYNFRVLDMLDRCVRSYNGSLHEPVKIHIKLDTGMHRLGFDAADLKLLAARIRNNPMLRVSSVFSHLAAAEDPAHDGFSREQIRSFDRMCEQLKSGLKYPFLMHILNSAGICRFPEAQFDMVRLGISLYGVPACPEQHDRLHHVSTLRSSVSQIKEVPARDTIGYNRGWTAESNMTIATVSIGYADGLNRRLSNGRGKLLVNGQFARIVGNICMDMCMIDVTGMQVKEGDEVIIFGKDYPIAELARDMETIPYEVLTGISGRVKRIYYQE